jgi:hypothetical protein
MKREIAKYVSECDTCRRVKDNHFRPTENLQPLSIPKWNGKISIWTSLWVCPTPHVGITRYGSLWIAWWSPFTLYPDPPPIGSRSMQSYICHTSSAIMAYRRPSFLTGDLYLFLTFGSNYMNVWAPILYEAQPIILKLTNILNESIKLLKICFVLVFWRMIQNETSTFH